MDLNITRTAFNPILPQHPSPALNLLEDECRRILATGERLELTLPDSRFPHLPYPLRLLLALHHALAARTSPPT